MFNKDDKRFIKIFKERTLTESMEILLDTETGVNYLYIGAGYGMGITPLSVSYTHLTLPTNREV